MAKSKAHTDALAKAQIQRSFLALAAAMIVQMLILAYLFFDGSFITAYIVAVFMLLAITFTVRLRTLVNNKTIHEEIL